MFLFIFNGTLLCAAFSFLCCVLGTSSPSFSPFRGPHRNQALVLFRMGRAEALAALMSQAHSVRSKSRTRRHHLATILDVPVGSLYPLAISHSSIRLFPRFPSFHPFNAVHKARYSCKGFRAGEQRLQDPRVMPQDLFPFFFGHLAKIGFEFPGVLTLVLITSYLNHEDCLYICHCSFCF